MSGKIRRSDYQSDFFQGGDPISVEQPLKYPFQGYKAKFGRSDWSKIDEYQEGAETPCRLRSRITYGMIEGGDHPVCQIKLVEYDFPAIGTTWLWEAMEGYNSAAADVMRTLISAWPDFGWTIPEYGRVLVIDRVWVEPGHTTSGIWIPIVSELLRRVERRQALVLAKAFPLEYEGQMKEGDDPRHLERRQNAMVRYYQRRLGLKPLPGKAGEQGWIWRPRRGLDDMLDQPVYQPGW